VGRKQLVAVIVVLVAVAAAVIVAAASRGGNPKPAGPTGTLSHMNGVGDDNANVMRRLQREKLKKSQK
jgi:hypothetical protein